MEDITRSQPSAEKVEALLDHIDELIVSWHRDTENKTLPEYLGVTEVEYSYFVEHPTSFAHAVLLWGHTLTDKVLGSGSA